MKQKVVAITGASVGIGAAAARKFIEGGHQVVLLARRKEKLAALQAELGQAASAFELDVTSRQQVEALFPKIEKQVGPIDILLNNAGGVFGQDKGQEAFLDDWEKTVAVNINGLLYCTHAVLPGMVKRNRGHIINLGSTAGNYPYPGGNAYCGAKAFVRQFSLCLRADLLGTKVRVSCIEPGLVEGTEFSVVRFKGDQHRVKTLYEKAEALTAEDVAEVIFLAAMLPERVNINSIEMMPVTQAFSSLSVHRKE